MQFRPCIDIHNGRVKQIVGSTLSDEGDRAKENFVADRDAAYYASMYKDLGLSGGHVIILNKAGSPYYDESLSQAMSALSAFPQGLMIGGGVNADNAGSFIDAGASHVIVTSFLFDDGVINMDNLLKLEDAVGAGHIVIDLSCKNTGDGYYVATNRWQRISDERVDMALFERLSDHCDEFLVHAVDAEGKKAGIDTALIGLLARVKKSVCYAGGISSYDDIGKLKALGNDHVNFTVGSRLDIFGGDLGMEEIIRCTQ